MSKTPACRGLSALLLLPQQTDAGVESAVAEGAELEKGRGVDVVVHESRIFAVGYVVDAGA